MARIIPSMSSTPTATAGSYRLQNNRGSNRSNAISRLGFRPPPSILRNAGEKQVG
jgi:hypothetical protein